MWMTRQELTVVPWICLAMDFYGDFADRIGQGKKITMSRKKQNKSLYLHCGTIQAMLGAQLLFLNGIFYQLHIYEAFN